MIGTPKVKDLPRARNALAKDKTRVKSIFNKKRACNTALFIAY